jgi:hypothetical protein
MDAHHFPELFEHCGMDDGLDELGLIIGHGQQPVADPLS